MTCIGFIELVVHLYLSSFDVKTEQVDGGVARREEDAGEGEALEPDGGDDGGDSGDDAVADGDLDGDGGVDGNGGDGAGEGKV